MAEPKDVLVAVLQLLVGLVYTAYCVVESLVLTFVPRRFRMKDVTGDIVLVTGGGSGIGRLMCLSFAKKGARIVTWDVDEAGNKETMRQVVALGGTCRTYTVDLCDRHAVYKAADRVKEEVGKVDILVNNAGIVTGKTFMESPDDHIVRTFQVNTLAHFWTVKAFLNDMMDSNKGHIVNIASMAGWVGCNGLVDYCSSKFAAVGFDEGLKLELKVLGKTGVKTTCVCPIYISTGMFEGVQSRVLPILTPEYVAQEAVDATLMNQRMLMLPPYVRLLALFRVILPDKANYFLGKIAGVTVMMDNFVGRSKSR
ncbi:short-chain dehydrogenase/reductase family 16C member 6-like [Penaeus chinensis]|uniref:short-chain dehydrogenase/reductase family 16C member 6-like n=1 Tax=Penaeus chinensis TaxID=139456 RepID=UPI001FB5D454|nr:short-chain dehydrogenase/reductase family 16C member 6-like [Penaeus chinensis]